MNEFIVSDLAEDIAMVLGLLGFLGICLGISFCLFWLLLKIFERDDENKI